MKKVVLLLFGITFLFSCQQENKSKEVKKVQTPGFDRKAYMNKGKILAKTSFKTFKGKIQEVAQTKGLPEVVNFCHDNANKLADSIGKAHNVIIKRTSNKLRNPENAPDNDQKAVITNYLALQENPNKPMEPIVIKDDKGFVHFYAPIKLKKDCLKCHGVPEDEVKEPIMLLLKKNYPNDKATGFKEGELRGIWDIKFLEKPE